MSVTRDETDRSGNLREPGARTAAPRRTVLKAVPLGVGLGAFGSGSGRATASDGEDDDDYWTVVALPDTQNYVTREELASFARDQTEWVIDEREAERIRFVTHEGDLVRNGADATQWDRIETALSTLDGEVPYATVPGNHDWASTGDKRSSLENYLSRFGRSRFVDRCWYGGASPNGYSSFQLFSGGDHDFLHLALAWEPPGTVDDPETTLGWAQSVLNAFPRRPAILTTHSYLRSGGRTRALQTENGDGNTGEAVWQRLVRPNPQVFMVLNGHWHIDDKEYRQVSTNDAGLRVFEMLANYQSRPNGGDSLLRRIQFRPAQTDGVADRIRVETYAPTHDEFLSDDDSEFEFELDFAERFSRRAWTD